MFDMDDDKAKAGYKQKNQGEPITLDEFTDICKEIEDQPLWRGDADKEMDYVDGKQLDSELLAKQKTLGIPPAMENVIAPQIQALEGYEAKTRRDWRITPDGDPDGVDVADALNHRLNQAERHSKADSACTEAFHGMAAVGVGWVEVSKNSNPFEFPYRCRSVRRGEIWWDMLCDDKRMLSDARWLVRSRWVDPKRLESVFPEHRALFRAVASRWSGDWDLTRDGNVATGLANSWDTQRNWSIDEQNWYSEPDKRARLYEVWYRRWVSVPVLHIPSQDGSAPRTVEFDEGNQAHVYSLASGVAKVVRAVIPRMRRAFFLGPHMLHDGCTPYKHHDFPYIPFFHNLEDNTGVPYGVVRSMIFPQDSLNAGTAKLRWGMSAVRVERTKGAVAMDDAVFREQVARVDADIVLNADHMAQQGAMFKVHRDYQLNSQHFQMLAENRASIERTSGISSAFQGKTGSATSGLQEQTQVEQANQALAGLMQRFGECRSKVGELLLSLIIEDIGRNREVVVIDVDPLKERRSIVLNAPEVDPRTGIQYLSNDVQRIRLKVALEDVPTTSSFRAQQLAAMSEVVKAMPPQAQGALIPHLLSLMDVPNRKDIVEAVKKAMEQESPEAVEQRIKQAEQDAVAKAGMELKAREVAIKEGKAEAEKQEIMNRAVQIGVQAAYAAMQAGQVISTIPQVAPLADQVMASAGYKRPIPMGDDPNFPVPQGVTQGVTPPATVNTNTSPQLPPVPQQASGAMDGIETPELTDNTIG